MVEGRDTDVAIVGGGLAGGLIALALHRARPDTSLRLIEAGERLGGNHRWSWFASDLSADGKALLEPFQRTAWDTGYEVRFPAYSRTLRTGYRSLASSDFADTLMRELPEGSVRLASRVTALDQGGVTLASGERIAARTVIDCRTFEPSPALTGGWQLFLGRQLRTIAPHGITRPIIMDATVDQHDPAGNEGAYRFVYTLPLTSNDVFFEDTYYADSPVMDRSLLSGRIDGYVRQAGLTGEYVASEAGVLPVITGGDFAAYQAQRRIAGVAMAGARGGFTHPLTSYTVPIAVGNALAIARAGDLPGADLARMLEARAKAHWADTRFYRSLGAMLFGAADPPQRYRIFEHFYRLPEPLIERFYAVASTRTDRLRILCGKPPTSIPRAIRALALGGGGPLTKEQRS